MLLVRDASLCRRPFCGNIFWGHIAERFWGVEYVSKNFKRTKYGRRNKSIPPRKCRQIQTTRTTTIITLITPWRQRTLNKIFEILSWFFNGVVHWWHINIPSRWRLRGSPLFRIRNTCTHADEHHYKVPSYPTVQEHESISSRDSHGTGGPTRVRCPSIGLCIIIVQCNMWFHWMEWGGAYKGMAKEKESTKS